MYQNEIKEKKEINKINTDKKPKKEKKEKKPKKKEEEIKQKYTFDYFPEIVNEPEIYLPLKHVYTLEVTDKIEMNEEKSVNILNTIFENLITLICIVLHFILIIFSFMVFQVIQLNIYNHIQELVEHIQEL